MSYRSRSLRKLERKSKRNFLVTIALIILLFYITISWILPNLINFVGTIRNTLNPTKALVKQDIHSLAPPVLNIQYEATNTGQIDILGFANPSLKVKIFLDDEEKQTVDVLEDGTFIAKNISLNLGTNNIYGKTADDQNQQSLPSKNIRLIFDNEKPPLSISEPDDNKVIQGGDRKAKVSGKTEPGVQIFINNTQVIVSKDGNFSSDQSLNDGDNNFEIKAVDSASNTTEISRKVTFQP